MGTPTMNDPNNQERSIFLKAIEFDSPAEQAAYLNEACGDDAELGQKIEALLKAHQHSGDLLDRSAMAASLPTPRSPNASV